MRTTSNRHSPFFSIIVPTYNQAEYLKQALESIIGQTYLNWEAVVVNDGSTDQTKEVLESYANKDGRIRPIHKNNGGTASALNEGFKNARGEWLGWLSSDDLYEPYKLALNYEWIQNYPDSKFFFSYFKLLWDESGKIEEHDLWGPLPEREFYLIGLFYRNFISGISICFHRDIFNNVGFFNEEYRFAQDYDMWLRVICRFSARFIPVSTCINRTHPNQGSNVFPEACYYDTSKSAIRFINEHPFAEWFPLLDLRNVEHASKAILKTLEIARHRTAYIYALGFHDGLIERVMEFVSSSELYVGKQNAKYLQNLLTEEILKVIDEQSDNSAKRFWQEVSVAIQNYGFPIGYNPVNYILLATSRIRNNKKEFEYKYLGRNSLEALQRYLKQFEGVDVNLPFVKRIYFTLISLITLKLKKMRDSFRK